MYKELKKIALEYVGHQKKPCTAASCTCGDLPKIHTKYEKLATPEVVLKMLTLLADLDETLDCFVRGGTDRCLDSDEGVEWDWEECGCRGCFALYTADRLDEFLRDK